MKNISNFIFKNIWWKLLAFIFAILLWLLCLNLTENIITKSFSVPLTLVNEDVLTSNNYVLLNHSQLLDKNIKINVTADKVAFAGITSKNFRANIDLAPLNFISEHNINKDQSINVEVELVGISSSSKLNSAMINADPGKATIVVDKVDKETKMVTVNTTGSPDENYIALAGSSYPESVEITGPSTVLSRISTVIVEVDVEGATAEISDNTLEPRVYDIYKEDITDQVELNVKTVEAIVPINMSSRIPLEQKVVGTPAEGYSVTSRNVASGDKTVEYVEVVGDPEDIKALRSIKLPDFNVEGKSFSSTETYDLRKLLMDTNNKLSIKGGTPSEIKVTVNIEQLVEKEITISEYSINVYGLSNLYPLQFSRSDVSFRVWGLPEKMEGFTSEDIISASINVAGLEPGVHSVPVNVLLPKDISIMGDQPVIEVVITETQEESPEDDEENAE